MRRRRLSGAVNIVHSNTVEVHAPEGPTLRSSLPYKKAQNVNQIFAVNLDMLTTCLRECQHCTKGPLDLSNISEDVRTEGVCPVIKVRCGHCLEINTLRPAEQHRTGKRAPPTFDINSRSALGAIHMGLGHSHYTGLLSTIGLPTLTSRNFKTRERECGKAIEAVAKESCELFTEKEKQQCEKGEEEQTVKVGVSYDMGWRKRGRSYDSSSGAGTAIGLKTGKVLSYATRNTLCRVCDEAQKKKQESGAHDCRRNHHSSSKSMEANVAVELFSSAVKSGASYSVYVGDDDSTTENCLKTLVNYPIEKWSDINHASRLLGSRLYSAKAKVKGLTPTVIGYIQKCFTYCINQNAGKPKALQEGLSSIVPHAFGEHESCKEWCKYKKDPANYTHSELSGGKDLNGDDLRACIEDAMQPFLSEEAAKKMAPVGSSQRNECVNSVIGSKAPKIRHYGGSESSDIRTAAGVAQFNKGHGYIIEATEKLGIPSTVATETYVEKMEKKQEKEARRKSSKEFKRARRTTRKKKNQKTHSIEKHEGSSYEPGIGFCQSAEDKTVITNGTISDLKTSIAKEEFDGYVASIKTPNKQSCETPKASTSMVSNKDGYLFVVFDTETTGLDRNSELLQISCASHDGSATFSTYLLPQERTIADSATKVHGISVQYRNGSKVLVKRGKQLTAASQTQGLTDFCSFLHQQHKGSCLLVLIAHNGDRFDFPILLNALTRNSLLDNFLSTEIMLLESLKLISVEMKQKSSPLKSCKSKSLSDLYGFFLHDKFDAHDAQEDVAALADILFRSNLKLSVESLVAGSISGVEFVQGMQSALEAKSRKSTLQRMPISEGMKDKLGKAGFDLKVMEEIYEKGGARGLLVMLALPETYDQIGYNNKPRVTKNLKVFTKIIASFEPSH